MLDMKRRGFIALLGGSVVARPLTARAQQPAIPVVGFLHGASPDAYAPMVTALRQGLTDTGYVEVHNVAIDYRWAEGHYDQLPALAADLVHRRVAGIVTGGTPTTIAAKAMTSTVPIIFSIGIDPVQAGLVASLNRPSGNLTGVVVLIVELAAKRLQLLHELVPQRPSLLCWSIQPLPLRNPK